MRQVKDIEICNIRSQFDIFLMTKKKLDLPLKKRSSPRHQRFISRQRKVKLTGRGHILQDEVLNMIRSEQTPSKTNFFKTMMKNTLWEFIQKIKEEIPSANVLKLIPNHKITTERQFWYIMLKVRFQSSIWQSFYEFFQGHLMIFQETFDMEIVKYAKFKQQSLKIFSYLDELNKQDLLSIDLEQAFKLCFVKSKTSKREYKMYLLNLNKEEKLAQRKKTTMEKKCDQ